MGRVQITSQGIKKTLNRYKYEKAIAEYIWNGFDAGADDVEIVYQANELGALSQLEIRDNGSGIPYKDLESKFEPFNDSEKVGSLDEKRVTSQIRGKDGVGRLTFYHFSTRAIWQTVYEHAGKNYKYNIEVDHSRLEDYSNTEPEISSEETGTVVSFINVHGFLKNNIADVKDYLIQEFSWFLELNKTKGYQISINGEKLDYSEMIGDQDSLDIYYSPKYGTKAEYRRVGRRA